MRRSRLLVASVMLFVACSREQKPGDPPQSPEDLHATCDAAHVAVGPVCVPIFDHCREGESPNLGKGCTAIGPSCGSWFVPDAEGCSAIVPKEPCTDDELSLPGRTACEEVASCASPPVGDWYVDAAFVGVSDGSASKPFRTIGEALAVAADDQMIAIGDGRYAEDVTVARRVGLLGRCPRAVEIHGTTTAVTVAASALLSGISVTSEGQGIVVTNGTASVRASVVRDTGGVAIEVHDASELDLRHTSVRRARSMGVLFGGVNLVADQVMVSEVGGDGIAMATKATGITGTATLTDVLVEKTKGTGVRVLDDAVVTISEALVRDVDGIGIGSPPTAPAKGSSVRLQRVTIERAAQGGVRLEDAALVLANGTIRNVGGPGIDVRRASLTVTNSIVDAAAGSGIALTESDASLVQTIVRATRLAEGVAYGLHAEGGTDPGAFSKLGVEASIVRDSPGGGIVLRKIQLVASNLLVERSGPFGLAASASVATITRAIVRDTAGIGILASATDNLPTRFDLTDAIIENSTKAGVAAYGIQGSIHRVYVHDNAGVGVSVTPSTGSTKLLPELAVDGLVVERNHVAGLYVQANVLLEHVVARETGKDDAGQFGDGIVVIAGAPDVGSPLDLINIVSDSNARAGLAIFGLAVRMANTRARCNAVDIDLEPPLGVDIDGAKLDPVDDRGGNDCSCGGDPVRCETRSVGLSPSPPLAL